MLNQDGIVKNGLGKEVRPIVRILPEEPMVGYWERHLLALTRGEVDVWKLAQGQIAGKTSPVSMV